MAFGMTSSQFWDEDILLFSAYVEANEIARRREDFMAWANGAYIRLAVTDVLESAFSKNPNRKSIYPEKPIFTEPTKFEAHASPGAVSKRSNSEKEKARIGEALMAQLRALNDKTNAAALGKE